MLEHSLWFVLTVVAQAEFPLEGTQPGELADAPEPATSCNCHLSFDNDAITEPGQTFAPTAMALSARDPLFRAALELAFRDEPRLSPTCLRCHAPAAWLGGRSSPGDASQLLDEDLGVTCDVCHRMIEPPGGTHIGDGQYVIAPETDKRARRGNSPVTGGHSVVQSSYQSTSEMCGVCHSLFNPIQRAHAPDGTELPFNYYEQRTYEEWRDSVFPSRNRGCIECHMKRVDGFACRERVNRYPDLAHHGIVGANTFAPRAVALLNARLSNPDPLLMLDAELAALESWVDESLASAASLAITSTHARPARAPAGGSVGIDVRLTNLTGHKLPTGYPEGRRVYLEVALHLQGRDPIVVSGEWDPATGDLIDDPQIRTYETSHGQLNVGRSQHLALANQVLSDTRLPPEGFRPNARDMEPAGRDYGQPPYRHWDEVHFEVPIPADVAPTTTGTIAVRALHQTTTGQYVRFLVFSVGTQHQAARDLAYAFDALGRSPPKQMVVRRLPIVVTEPEAPDAGVADAGAVVPQPEEGCSCRSTTSRGSTALVLSLLLLVSRRARRRRG